MKNTGNNLVVLDSSALLAYVLQEKAGEIIEAKIPYSIISTVNFSEVLAIMQRKNCTIEEMKLVKKIIPVIMPFDASQSITAAEIATITKPRGLSLGDRACIALGMHVGSPIYTADRAWCELSIKGADIRVIR